MKKGEKPHSFLTKEPCKMKGVVFGTGCTVVMVGCRALKMNTACSFEHCAIVIFDRDWYRVKV